MAKKKGFFFTDGDWFMGNAMPSAGALKAKGFLTETPTPTATPNPWATPGPEGPPYVTTPLPGESPAASNPWWSTPTGQGAAPAGLGGGVTPTGAAAKGWWEGGTAQGPPPKPTVTPGGAVPPGINPEWWASQGGAAPAGPAGGAAPAGIDQTWWSAFTTAHKGKNPIEEYMAGGWYKDEQSALSAALSDKAWGEQFARTYGRAPTDDDWRYHWFASRGLYSDRGGPGDVERPGAPAETPEQQQARAALMYPAGAYGSPFPILRRWPTRR